MQLYQISKTIKIMIMNFKKLFIFSALILTITLLNVKPLFAQDKRANIWYFGEFGGIDFNSGSAVALTNGILNTVEGCATICDDNGNLLFYTDGVEIFNKQHLVMSNGSGLFGGNSSSQSALIVPVPGNAVLYYIFTVAQTAGANGFCYSIVDITLDNGNGEVTSKNVAVLNSVALSEKLAGTIHSNGQDIWVCVRANQTNTYYSYLITSSGLNPPVISTGGTVTSGSSSFIGYMKFSHNGTKLASAVYSSSVMDLFDFNNTTGVLSNVGSYTMPLSQQPYGIEFSPQDSRLYVSAGGATGYDLYQLDMSLSTNAAILASASSVNFRQSQIYGIQAAPDGKIYICYYQNNWMGTIENPELPGSFCNVVDSALFLGNGHRNLAGLPNYISNYFNVTGTNDLWEGNTTPFEIYPNPGNGVFSITSTQGILKIFNIDGKLIYINKFTQGFQSIDISEFPNGVYIVSLQTEHSTYTKRLVIAQGN